MSEEQRRVPASPFATTPQTRFPRPDSVAGGSRSPTVPISNRVDVAVNIVASVTHARIRIPSKQRPDKIPGLIIEALNSLARTRFANPTETGAAKTAVNDKSQTILEENEEIFEKALRVLNEQGVDVNAKRLTNKVKENAAKFMTAVASVVDEEDHDGEDPPTSLAAQLAELKESEVWRLFLSVCKKFSATVIGQVAEGDKGKSPESRVEGTGGGRKRKRATVGDSEPEEE